MALLVSDSLKLTIAKPVDTKCYIGSGVGTMSQKYGSISGAYKGLIVYVHDEDKYYKVIKVENGKITSDGYEEFTTGGGGDSVSLSDVQTSGTKIATITINGGQTELKVPDELSADQKTALSNLVSKGVGIDIE